MKTEPNHTANPIYTVNSEGQITDMHEDGLTKREYFAAMAMQGLCANSALDKANNKGISEVAVTLADELISTLNK